MQQQNQIQQILAVPFVPERIALADAVRNPKMNFGMAELESFWDKLLLDEPQLERDIAQARQLIEKGELASDCNLWNESSRLVWAGALTYLKRTPDVVKGWPKPYGAKKLKESRAWEAFLDNPFLLREMRRSAVTLFYAGANKEATIAYGAPGSWFWFNPKDNHVNIDVLMSMICGFKESQTVLLHEITHSHITTQWPDIVTEARTEFEALVKEAKERRKQKIDPTDQQKEAMLRAAIRVQMMSSMFNSFEDNPVNSFSVDKGLDLGERKIKDDFNWLETVICGIGKNSLISKDPMIKEISQSEAQPMQKFGNLCHAINQVFFKNNGLFPDTPAGWAEVKLTDQDFKAFLNGHTREDLIGRIEKATLMRPETSDIIRGEGYFKWRAEQAGKARSDAFADLWKEYGEKLFEEAFEWFKNNPPQSQPGDPGDNDGDFEGGSPGGLGGESEGDGDGDGEGQDADGDSADGSGQSGGKGKKGKPRSKVGDGKGDAAGDQDKEDAENAGGKDDKKKDKTLNDHVNDAKNDGAADDAKREMNEQAQRDALRNKAQAAAGGWSYDDLPLGDFRDYQAQVRRLMPAILRLRKQIARIIAKQQRQIISRAKREYTLLPEDGNLKRLDDGRRRDFENRLRGGQPLGIDDLAMFTGDQTKLIPLYLKFMGLVDGSGSMMFAPNGGSTNQLRALQAEIIFYEAARPFSCIGSYIMMWGPNNPTFLAKPGDDYNQIGESIIGAVRGLNSGTDLAPSLDLAVEELSNPTAKKAKNQPIMGTTALKIYSDGDIFDQAASVPRLARINKPNSGVTTDICILSDDKNTAMYRAAEEAQRSGARIGVDNQMDPEKIASTTIAMMLHRLETTPLFAVSSKNVPNRMRNLRHQPKRPKP